MEWDRVHRMALDDVEIAFRLAGSGAPLYVLVHGWPQTGRCWQKVVDPLAERGTVAVPDLRGYGDSGLATTGYTKRDAAGDLAALVAHLGHEQAVVVGHDRGARVAHRMALDHPDKIAALALLDILPTRVVMDSFDREQAAYMWHWFFHLQPELPELLIAGNVEPYLRFFMGSLVVRGVIDEDTFAHYVRAFSDPAHLQATLEDYRAGFTADLEQDEADHTAGLRVRAPLLLLWGADGALGGTDVVGVWKEHHADPAAVRGRAVPGGHYVPEEAPAEVLAALAELVA
ncbi:alpha/beta fold hydrolase [Pseudonocardia thermophila]|jgi:Predicted hydrolases or acyltransferases (alpha/beta hydrolase superfamily)|uniref:alpha/beta fold hydrolase n=1 Tax=Pseudonocardia thermophila TaxID=1848 RepID=UPI00248F3A88|nr:alpha/beta hydrolase [Pseudonocardia thermophila]